MNQTRLTYRTFWLTALLLIAWLLAAASLLAQSTPEATAAGPTNVTLISFTLTSQSDGVAIAWATGSELNTVGFRIERATGSSNAQFATVAGLEFVLATGSPTIGNTYNVVDDTAVLNTTYTYRLVEIESNSAEVNLADATIFYNMAATATPNTIGGSNPTPTRTTSSAATATPSRTPTATGSAATPTSSGTNATATPQARFTVVPTATPPAAAAATTTTNTNTAPSSVNPTATINANPATTTGGIAVAQAQELTPESGYPAPENAASDSYPDDTTAPQPTANPYPDGQVPTPDTAAPAANPTAYPGGSNPTIIGANATPTATGDTAVDPNAPTNEQVTVGRVFMWGGFIVALLLFIVAVLGAITLFTRQKS